MVILYISSSSLEYTTVAISLPPNFISIFLYRNILSPSILKLQTILIEQKIFHAEIVVDHTKISAEEKAYQKIPVINDFKDRNGNDIMMQQIQRNYDQIKADAQAIINEEMRRIKNDPELRKRLGLEGEKGKEPDKS